MKPGVKPFLLRAWNMLFGTFLYALGIAAMLRANIGYAPWEVFHVGLSHVTGMSIGTASIVAGLVIVAVVTAMGEKLGLGTVCSMILTGVFLDGILALNVIPLAEGWIAAVLMLIAGLWCIAFGSYFYIKSAFGVGPRDNLMVVLARKTKLPVGVCRGGVELTALLIGWLLGGMVGYGTIIAVALIGLCIQLTFRLFKFDPTKVKHETLPGTLNEIKRLVRG